MEVPSHRSKRAFAMRRLSLATVVLATAVVGSAGHADEIQNSQKSNFEIKTFKIQDVDNSAPVVNVIDTTVTLMGDPELKDFGLAYRGKLRPTVDLSGEEKLDVDLYARCDSQTPSRTEAVNVGTVEIGAIKGKGELTMIATKDAKTFVPLKDVQCAKIRIEGYVPKGPAFVVKTLPILNGDELSDVTISDTTVTLMGDPDSKDFGLAYRGKLKPNVEMGNEKLAVYLYLYTRCDGQPPDQTRAVNVGSLEIGSIKKTKREYTLIAAKDAKAFVPLKDVQCARVEIE
jgi:hypothetical protein